jgi:hypothetical protein
MQVRTSWLGKLEKGEAKLTKLERVCIIQKRDAIWRLRSEASLWEDVWGELESSLHVSLDLELALHEGSLRVELAREEVSGIVVEDGEGGVGLAFLALLYAAVAVLEVDGPGGGGFALGRGDFHEVDVADLLDSLGSLGREEGLHLVEDGCNFHWELYLNSSPRHISYHVMTSYPTTVNLCPHHNQ